MELPKDSPSDIERVVGQAVYAADCDFTNNDFADDVTTESTISFAKTIVRDLAEKLAAAHGFTFTVAHGGTIGLRYDPQVWNFQVCRVQQSKGPAPTSEHEALVADGCAQQPQRDAWIKGCRYGQRSTLEYYAEEIRRGTEQALPSPSFFPLHDDTIEKFQRCFRLRVSELERERDAWRTVDAPKPVAVTNMQIEFEAMKRAFGDVFKP